MNESITDGLTKRLNDAVDVGRRNEKWRTQYMKEWVLLQDAKDEGIEEGYEKGLEKAREEAVRNLMH